jgi:hypothetical protein
MKKITCLALVLQMTAAIPALAHHTVAYSFDISKLVALTGTVTAVEWKNPHVVYRLAVPDANGVIVNWEIESRHLQGMRRAGIEPDTIRVGESITMNVMVARDASHRAATASVVLPTGSTVTLCTVTDGACPSQ